MELFRALAVLAEASGADLVGVAEALGLPERLHAAAYTETFTLQLYPYASVYLGDEGMLGGEARDRIAGFWRALHAAPPAEPDHLAALLAAYASLREAAEAAADERLREALEHARRVLLWEHLLSWLPAYLAKLAEVAPPGYRRWGELLGAALLEEAEARGEPDALALHLRSAREIADPRVEGAEAFLASLLAPVRSGMILVRDDLARAARELGAGLRYGERRFVLKALMGQDAAAVVGWLEREAHRWGQLHRAVPPRLGRIGSFWAGRADATAALLASLRSEASACA